MTTIKQLIDRTLELDEAATDGPWHVCGGSECTVLVSEAPGMTSDADFELMDEYRTAAPALARECLRMRKVMTSMAMAMCLADHMGDAWDNARKAFELLGLPFMEDDDGIPDYYGFESDGGVSMYSDELKS